MVGAPWARATSIAAFSACLSSCAFDLEEVEATPGAGSDAYAHSADAEAGVPESGVPESGVPESGLTETGIPESGLGDTSADSPSVDACTAQADDELCVQFGLECGPLDTTDSCGQARHVDCGACGVQAHCDNGTCVDYAYGWVTGGWSSCSVNCGEGTMSRDVHCQRDDGQAAADAACPSPKPAQTQACNSAPCCVTPATMQANARCAGTTSDIPNYHWDPSHFGLDNGTPDNQALCAAQCTAWAEMDGLTAWCCDLVEDSTDGFSYACAIHTGLTIASYTNPKSDGAYAVLGSCQTP
jgi:hypothetical protein